MKTSKEDDGFFVNLSRFVLLIRRFTPLGVFQGPFFKYDPCGGRSA